MAGKKKSTARKPAAETLKMDIGNLNVNQLRALAREAGVTGFSRMRKQELIELLSSPARLREAGAEAQAAIQAQAEKKKKSAVKKKTAGKKKTANKTKAKKVVAKKKPGVKKAAAGKKSVKKKKVAVRRSNAKKKSGSGTTASDEKRLIRAVSERRERTPFLNIPPQSHESDRELIHVDSDRNPQAPTVKAHTASEPGSAVPEAYGHDILQALVRDPEWIYVYWEMSGGRLDELRRTHSSESINAAKWILRVETAGHEETAEIQVGGFYGNWYVHVASGARYDFTLGLRTKTDEFLHLAEMKGVETPRKGVSDVVDESWMIIRRDLERLMAAMGEEETAGGSSRGSGLVHAHRERLNIPRAIAFFSASLVRLPGSVNE